MNNRSKSFVRYIDENFDIGFFIDCETKSTKTRSQSSDEQASLEIIATTSEIEYENNLLLTNQIRETKIEVTSQSISDIQSDYMSNYS